MYDLDNINRIRAKAGKLALSDYGADDIARGAAERGVDIEQALTSFDAPAEEEPQPENGMTSETVDPFADQIVDKTASEGDAS